MKCSCVFVSFGRLNRRVKNIKLILIRIMQRTRLITLKNTILYNIVTTINEPVLSSICYKLITYKL